MKGEIGRSLCASSKHGITFYSTLILIILRCCPVAIVRNVAINVAQGRTRLRYCSGDLAHGIAMVCHIALSKICVYELSVWGALLTRFPVSLLHRQEVVLNDVSTLGSGPQIT